MSRTRWLLASLAVAALGLLAAEPPAPADAADRVLKVPDGFVVERVAGPPLVEHPMNGCFDQRGRLFLTESAGLNLKAEELLVRLPNSIRRLEDTHGDGKFDKATVFADKMTFPQGACCYDGALFTTAYPSVWRLDGADGDGAADKRTEIVGKFGSIGNAADLHGPKLGPDGMLYFGDGRNGHDIKQPDGFALKGRAAAVYRCRPDGSHAERVCGGGMDNPVEVAFTPAGEPLVVANIVLNSPRHDAILFALEGAMYPYYEAMYPEFKRTGDPMPLTGDLGWVAVSSFIRYRGDGVRRRLPRQLFHRRVQPAPRPPAQDRARRGRLPRDHRGLPDLRRPGFSPDRPGRGRRRQFAGHRHRRLVPHRLSDLAGGQAARHRRRLPRPPQGRAQGR